MINDLARDVHKNARAKGFYDYKKNIGEMLALIHSEVSEALEADRNKQYCNINSAESNVLMGWVDDIDFQKDYKDKDQRQDDDNVPET